MNNNKNNDYFININRIALKTHVISIVKNYLKDNNISFEKYSRKYLKANYRCEYTMYMSFNDNSKLMTDEIIIKLLNPVLSFEQIKEILLEYYNLEINLKYMSISE